MTPHRMGTYQSREETPMKTIHKGLALALALLTLLIAGCGENAPGEVDCYSVIEKLPKIRIDYEPPIPFSI